MRKLFAILVWSLLLFGCGSEERDFLATSSGRTNELRVLEDVADLTVDGDPVTLARLTAFDEAGELVFGPAEESYDEEMIFRGIPDLASRVELEYQRAQGFTLAKHAAPINFAGDDDGVITLNNVSPQLLGTNTSTMTVRVVNRSDYPADQVYLCLLGRDQQLTTYYYMDFGRHGSAVAQPFGSQENSQSYSFPLSALLKENDNTYSFRCPYDKLVSGRIYLSFGKKLEGLGLVPGGGPNDLVTPSSTGAPDAQTLYEFAELSATVQDSPGAEYILYTNTSVVDFFSVGVGLSLDYHDDVSESSKTESVGFVDGARQKVLDAFRSSTTPEEFQRYILKDGTSSVIRVLSPVQSIAIDANGTTSRFLDSAINQGWDQYAAQVLNIPDNLSFPYGYRWTGQLVTAGRLAMTCIAKPGADTAGGDLESLGEVCNLPKPTSRIVFFCDDDGPLVGQAKDSWKNIGSQGHKRLCSLLSAALNRGVFENYSDWDKADKFYSRPDGKYNHYSKIMHQFALNGKVYGFGYDDVYGQDPTLSERLSKVNQVVLEIPPFPRL